MITILAALAATMLSGQSVDEPIEAKDAFLLRQEQLIDLSRRLGTLHRLHQLCGRSRRSDLYRTYMRQLVPLEEPMGRTRLDMIEAFNAGFRDASNRHLACTNVAQADFEQEAKAALQLTDGLYAAFR